MFRRSKPEDQDAAATATVVKPGGKGRPTPTRKEAEAAARARAKASAKSAGGKKASRSVRAERSRQVRQAIKDGDERYLPARDRGPVRRFVRDYVDHRLCLAEFAIPTLFVSLLFSSAGQSAIGSSVLNAGLLMIVLDSVLLRFRLRKELRQRFPDSPYKGTTLYALMRALQLRFLRLPKPQLRLGQPLKQRY